MLVPYRHREDRSLTLGQLFGAVIVALFIYIAWRVTRPRQTTPASTTPSTNTLPDFSSSHSVEKVGVSQMGVMVQLAHRGPGDLPDNPDSTRDCLSVSFTTAVEGTATRSMTRGVTVIPLPREFGNNMRDRLNEQAGMTDPGRLMHVAGQVITVGWWRITEMASASAGKVDITQLLHLTAKDIKDLKPGEYNRWKAHGGPLGEAMAKGWVGADVTADKYTGTSRRLNYAFAALVSVARELAQVASATTGGNVSIDDNAFRKTREPAPRLDGAHTQFHGGHLGHSPRAAATQLVPAPEPVAAEPAANGWSPNEDEDTDPGRPPVAEVPEPEPSPPRRGRMGLRGPGRVGLGPRSLPRTSPGGPIEAVGKPPGDDVA